VSILCFYHFLGHLGAEILTAKGWQKSVKFWRARIFLLTPIFCDFLAWRAGTTRLGQCGRKSAHISRPAGCSQLLSDYTRRRQHLQRRTLARWERSQLLCSLPGQNSKKILHWTCILYNFVWAYILSTHIFWRRQYFINANILTTPIFFSTLMFCQRLYFINANILLMPIFCWRQ
jgi:hypothetical protein